MNNIEITKAWTEDEIVEVKLTAKSEFVSAFQYCYIDGENLKANGLKLISYIKNPIKNCYLEFGQKKGDYTPAFSLDFLEANKNGRVTIEVDMEIDDNDSRKHRACFFIYSELGLVEIFANKLMKLVHEDIDEINLNQQQID